MKRMYLNKTAEQIAEIENKYNFIPNETPAYVVQNSIDKVCLKTTKRIANTRQKTGELPESMQFEKSLREFRDYGVNGKID